MALEAAASGTTLIVATPHMKDVNEFSSPEAASKLCVEITRKVVQSGTSVEIVMGMENHLVPQLPQMFEEGRAMTLNGTGYALIEMPFFGYPGYLEKTLLQVQELGIVPVLAHPERIEAVQESPELLVDFVKKGMLSQVTAGSLLGHFGSDVRNFTEDLIRNELVHVIASDCHSPKGPRSPSLSAGLEAAVALVGWERAQAMVVDVPRAIVQGDLVTVANPRLIQPINR